MFHIDPFNLVVGIYVSISTLGFVGNTLAFQGFQKLQNKTVATFLFQALAFADNAVICVLALLSITFISNYNGNILIPIADIVIQSSINITVLMSITRLVAVLLPFHAKRICTMIRAYIGLAISVVIAVINNSLYFVFCDWKSEHNYINIKYRFDMCSLEYMILFRLVTFCVIPFILISLTTVALIVKLKQQRNRLNQSNQQNNPVSKILIAILLVFIICSLPFPVSIFAYYLYAEHIGTYGFFILSVIIYVSHVTNSSVNFVIYTCFSTQYREIMKVKQCSCRRQQPNEIELN